MYRRVVAFMDDAAAAGSDGDVVVVTHGGVIRMAQAYAEGIGVEDMVWGPVPNASVWNLSRPRPAVTVSQ
jgi:broad specificity phosphatase PhoE